MSGEVGDPGANGLNYFPLLQPNSSPETHDRLRAAAEGPSRSSTHPGNLLDPCWKHYPVIEGHHSCFSQWHVLNLVALLYTASVTPFTTAFLEPRLDVLFFADRLIDLFFFLDMVMQFFTSYPDPKRPERFVRDPPAIIRRYLSGWFFIDVVTVLPLDAYFMISKHQMTGASTLRNLKILRVLRLTRLLRLARFARLLEQWHSNFGFSYGMLSLMKFCVVIFICCHWMACLWGAMALHSKGDRNWLRAVQASKGGPDEFYDNTTNVYCMSLYWAIVTLTGIGYGDITPQTASEYWVASTCTSVMAAIWAYVIGAVCGIVSTLQPHEVNFKRTMDDLNWLMVDRGMPHKMCTRFRRYFHEARDINRHRNELDVIEQMSPMLQGEFAMLVHSFWIQKVWYLRGMHRELIIWVARKLQMMVFAPNEEVLNERKLYIVRKGVCARSGKILGRGDVWGEDMLLSNPVLRNSANARALSYLSVLMLHIGDFIDVVVAFPKARRRLRWAQIRIAVMRGVRRLACTIRSLQNVTSFRVEDIDMDARHDLYTRILTGGITESTPPAEFLGRVDRLWTRRTSTLRVPGSATAAEAVVHHISEPALGYDPGSQQEVPDVNGTKAMAMLKELQRSLHQLRGKVENLDGQCSSGIRKKKDIQSGTRYLSELRCV